MKIRYALLAILVVLIGITIWSNISRAGESLIKSFRTVAPSVGALYTQNDSGDMKFTCTSTVIESEEKEVVLLTAGHCASDNQEFLVTFNGANFHRAVVWRLPPDVKDFKYKRKFGEPKVDMALFKVFDKLTIPEIKLGKDVQVVTGQDVIASGFPLGVTKVGYYGTVAGIYTRPGKAYGYLMLQIFGAPGSSGSAVIDVATNLVVGVLVAGKEGRAGLPVIFATPISYIKYLVSPEDTDRDESKTSSDVPNLK